MKIAKLLENDMLKEHTLNLGILRMNCDYFLENLKNIEPRKEEKIIS